MSNWKFHATGDAVVELLRGGGEFNEVSRLLNDLTPEQATLPISGSPYTIATVVAHLHYWQSRSLSNVGAIQEGPAKITHLTESFPDVAPDEWETLRSAFLSGWETAKVAALPAAAQDSKSNENTSAAYDLAETALHNAYHIGQIVLLRRIAGLWPPAEGDQNDW